ncbi:MAG: triose-phosphate isomerase [Candidatus Omnitrophica bacterium]|nr:triose-phosphate isomerase [Candidatus Omnitrophota bacterium]MBD3269230.1 triose-phosphate isomerase [Candidatus Omnitrophota bacterium]
MRKILIAGNWKMHKTSQEAVELINGLKRELADIQTVDILVCPPFTNLSEAADIIIDSNIALGAQNCHWEKEGAFTGEVSVPMLKSVRCTYVIAGHSERRKYFAESDEVVNKKIKAIKDAGLKPIFCLGETLEEREENKTFSVIETQLTGGLKDLKQDDLKDLIIAYEPVWAIGTGKTATPQQAEEVHSFIRKLLKEKFSSIVSDGLRILYGGSVKPDNTKDLINKEDIDGALVGGASLKVDSFSQIVKNSLG